MNQLRRTSRSRYIVVVKKIDMSERKEKRNPEERGWGRRKGKRKKK